jgi:septal ring factor EnvC (AmiA/AmiB activator)
MIYSNRGIFGLLFLLLFFFNLHAQNDRKSLEQEKKQAQKRIAEAQQILDQTTSKAKASIGQLNAINKQLEARSQLIRSISRELSILNEQITEDNIVIEALQNDLANLKKEYATMVYAAYKSRSSYSRLTFLFSSKTFDQFMMRFKYLQQYTEARQNQVRLINEVRNQLISEIEQLESRKIERESLLADKVQENKKLITLKKKQNSVLAQLKTREEDLKQEIAQRKDDLQKLEKLIADLIRSEMKKSDVAKGDRIDLDIDLTNITSSFEKNKSQLPWPVSSGFVTGRFGTHPHPIYKRIKVPNDGINIQTKEDEKVKAVFNGKVKKVAVVPGMKYVVIIQHGNYYTVYARLKDVFVHMGQDIKINDMLGSVNTDVNGVSELQFQVWKNTTKLDPELWLAKR